MAGAVPEAVVIARLTPDETEGERSHLRELLIDAVEGGASVGFLPPLDAGAADEYWTSVVAAMREGSRVLLVARGEGRVLGSVQLALEMRENGNHRAELIKLFVHSRARRRGIGRALMGAAEAEARGLGRTLLLLDTKKGSDAERLFATLGYTRFGEVPQYARSSDRSLHTTVFFYRELG